jgi:hypothetical protein
LLINQTISKVSEMLWRKNFRENKHHYTWPKQTGKKLRQKKLAFAASTSGLCVKIKINKNVSIH